MSLWIEKLLGKVLPLIFTPLTEADLVFNKTKEIMELPTSLEVTSPDFKDGEHMPWITGGKGVGENKSPALDVSNIPAEAKQLVFVMEDLDVPLSFPIVHMTAYNLGTQGKFPQGFFNGDDRADEVTFGLAFRGNVAYMGPQPLVNHGRHRYFMEFYALSGDAPLDSRLKIEQLTEAIRTRGIARGNIVGIFERTDAKHSQ